MAEAVSERYRLEQSSAASLGEAREFCADLARSHYENFSVVSWFLPRPLRQHFANLYAYCRISDDLADEVADQATALRLLDNWRGQLHRLYQDGDAHHPVFVALGETVATFDIPQAPFDDLLDAFVQDRHQTRYETFDELLDYCRRSADPVGRLVLYLGGYRDDLRQRLSDRTCTALQLTNFWQDVARDWDKGRVYLPAEDRERFGVTEDQLAEKRCDDHFRALLRFEVARSRELFREGLPLLDLVSHQIRRDVMLFSAGGWSVLEAIERQDYDTLSGRPALSKRQKIGLMARLLVGGRLPWQ